MPPASNPMTAARREIITNRKGPVASGCCSAAVLMPVTANWVLASAGGAPVMRVDGGLLSCIGILFSSFVRNAQSLTLLHHAAQGFYQLRSSGRQLATMVHY